MAYTTIYDILKQFENQVVKQNHYTKTVVNNTFATKSSLSDYAKSSDLGNYQQKSAILTSLLGKLEGAQTGLVKVTSNESSGGVNTISIDTKAYVTASDLYVYDAATGTLTLKKI